MGWYPHMYYYGGYWGPTSFVVGGIFGPSLGLFFEIGGRRYYGWDHYHSYVFAHPAPYPVTGINNDLYRQASHSELDRRPFAGTGHAFAAQHSFGSGRVFGGGRSAYAHRTFSTGRMFQGAFSSGGSHSFSSRSYGGHSVGGSQSFGGHRGTFRGGHSFGGGNANSHGGYRGR